MPGGPFHTSHIPESQEGLKCAKPLGLPNQLEVALPESQEGLKLMNTKIPN
jgi:hypothetical protein